MNKIIPILLCFLALSGYTQQQKNRSVNVFLGTSGDHGQMSPSATTPFNMMNLGPQTNPHQHTGYEYYAKEFDGFTHTRMEGVGCTGSGGNILIKPILNADAETDLIRTKQQATPGYYEVNFENGIEAQMTVAQNLGMHNYSFPNTNSGLFIDLSFALSNRFVSETHEIRRNLISGYIDTKTTCHAGTYRIYYAIKLPETAIIQELDAHRLLVKSVGVAAQVQVGFSSVNEGYAKKRITSKSFSQLKEEASASWEKQLNHIEVKGEQDRVDLFYSLLYRTAQSPFLVSEEDGTFRATDGSVQNEDYKVYNGWAIWDNYREQLPLLSLVYPDVYQDITTSIANLYRFGKKNWATEHETSPTVRTEHAMVVLLDAYKKGYQVDFKAIRDSLIDESKTLDFGAPDKALESSYDLWAMSEIFKVMGDTDAGKEYLNKALDYKAYWDKDFKDLTKNDVDRMQARGLYQGTIWQYRWFVPWDIKGLQSLAGGSENFTNQLDQFFEQFNYNHANQPDLQVPGLYNATNQPWKSQKLFREILLDTVVQTYFNDNSKGIDPFIGRIYQNKPKAYLRTMDDDAGTMSSWFVLHSIGLSVANVGSPIYYLTAPIFEEVKLNIAPGKTFKISVKNYNKDHFYVKSASLNGKPINRNWLTHQEIQSGGNLIIETSKIPNTGWGTTHSFITKVELN
ncbi:putative alpha-1,2-mannosidase [Leeuwenhoekiella aestuarii]|uniref:Putative alpha-1,2-mannosidase n=1 Tax=Leeuwenhoekiella aestuarii TaxID=2249426 RepID=A0A4Q0NTL4_9FLAO|nr:glycoside hydrolase domain-containing protein [Leeuwenhoekiella aestuarii]RXG13178.1 putative alpha-1,2-mannosidase [Leeuwenhoekiella aestuarii]RXG15086.1 putative alpha-1,2-mannosidase [Leeuwenhoekiella aestuarii]